MTDRAHISLTTKLASALLALGHVPYSDAKRMTAAEIVSLYQWDHGILHALGGTDDFWNLTPRLIPDHRAKTNGKKATSYGSDKHAIAKVDRLTGATGTGPKKKIPARSFPKVQRKIQSRPFERRA